MAGFPVFDTLDAVLLNLVNRMLHPVELVRFGTTNHRTNDRSKDETCWTRLIAQDFGRRVAASPGRWMRRSSAINAEARAAAARVKDRFEAAASWRRYQMLAAAHTTFATRVHLVFSDLRDLERGRYDAFVCPSHASLQPHGAATATLHGLAGPRLREHLSGHPRLNVGECAVTPGFSSGFIRLVHVVGPSLSSRKDAHKSLLYKSYINAFSSARSVDADKDNKDGAAAAVAPTPAKHVAVVKDNKDGAAAAVAPTPAKHVAVVSIGTGGNRLRPRPSAYVAMEAARDALAFGWCEEISFVLLEEQTRLCAAFKMAKARHARRETYCASCPIRLMPLFTGIDSILPRQVLDISGSGAFAEHMARRCDLLGNVFSFDEEEEEEMKSTSSSRTAGQEGHAAGTNKKCERERLVLLMGPSFHARCTAVRVQIKARRPSVGSKDKDKDPSAANAKQKDSTMTTTTKQLEPMRLVGSSLFEILSPPRRIPTTGGHDNMWQCEALPIPLLGHGTRAKTRTSSAPGRGDDIDDSRAEEVRAAAAVLRVLLADWEQLVREAGAERQPGQLERIHADLGPMPSEAESKKLAFWGAALINPLPGLGVAPEIRHELLMYADALKQLECVIRGTRESIAHLKVMKAEQKR